jgi:hypothetical protein
MLRLRCATGIVLGNARCSLRCIIIMCICSVIQQVAATLLKQAAAGARPPTTHTEHQAATTASDSHSSCTMQQQRHAHEHSLHLHACAQAHVDCAARSEESGESPSVTIVKALDKRRYQVVHLQHVQGSRLESNDVALR